MACNADCVLVLQLHLLLGLHSDTTVFHVASSGCNSVHIGWGKVWRLCTGIRVRVKRIVHVFLAVSIEF